MAIEKEVLDEKGNIGRLKADEFSNKVFFLSVMGLLIIFLLLLSIVAYNQSITVKRILYSPGDGLEVDTSDFLSVSLERESSEENDPRAAIYVYMITLSAVILILILLIILFIAYRIKKKKLEARGKLHVQQLRLLGYGDEDIHKAFEKEGWGKREINAFLAK